MNNILPPFISAEVYEAMTTDQKIGALQTVLVVVQKNQAANIVQRAKTDADYNRKVSDINAAIGALQAPQS